MLNFIIIFIVVIGIPGCILYFTIKKITGIVKEIRNTASYYKKKEDEDDNYYESDDGVNEYHQYSFYLPGSDSDRWKRLKWVDIEMAREIDPLNRLLSFYYKLRYPEKSNIFRQSELVHTFQNVRFNIKNKVVICENHSRSKRLLMKLSILSISLAGIGFAISVGLFLFYAGAKNEILSTFYATLFLKIMILWMLLIVLFGRNYNSVRLERKIKKQGLESLNFENIFDAYSSDPIEARMIINPAFMDKLEVFSKKYNLKGKIRIIFKKDSLTLIFRGDIYDFGTDSEGIPLLLNYFKNDCGLDYFFFNK